MASQAATVDPISNTLPHVMLHSHLAGTGRPNFAISATRPRALIAVVLPPVLDPVIVTTRVWRSMYRLIGTGLGGIETSVGVEVAT